MFKYQVRMHPTLDILVSSVGCVFLPQSGSHPAHWTFGYKKDKDGYLFVKVDGKPYAVGRLVADTFNLNPDHKDTIEHKNRNRQDNSVENITGATRAEQAINRQICDDCLATYGVHSSEDKNAYARARRKLNLEHVREIERASYHRCKEKRKECA